MSPQQNAVGTATKTIVTRLSTSLKQAIGGGKNSDIVEFGFFVDGAWKYGKLGTVAEIKQMLLENGIR